MSAKRALVVDDSKSARAFLAKLLEDHQLEVDSAETAEQAIDYLTRHRPDVIFMDHLMPGMDGFQAVQAIKSNPRTATIPILMYTSQEGELYLGQARALGAMGVLPKQVAPADVSKVLQQLHLTLETPAAAPLAAEMVETQLAEIPAQLADTVTAPAATPTAAPALGETLLRDQIAELRRFLVTSLDQQSERLLEEVRGMIRDATPPPPVERPPPRNSWPWALAAAAGIVTVALAVLLWSQTQRTRTLEARLEQAAAPALAAAPVTTSPPPQTPAASGAATVTVPEVTVIPVPFGEVPLAGRRVEQLRSLVNAVAASGATGTVEVRRYAGRFCLAGDRGNGYTLAEGSIPYLQCDLVADADDAQLAAAPSESLAFANALAELRKAHGPGIRIEVVAAGGNAPALRSYPEVGGTPPRVPTAAEWNAAAEANNRVEIRWHPGS